MAEGELFLGFGTEMDIVTAIVGMEPDRFNYMAMRPFHCGVSNGIFECDLELFVRKPLMREETKEHREIAPKVAPHPIDQFQFAYLVGCGVGHQMVMRGKCWRDGQRVCEITFALVAE